MTQLRHCFAQRLRALRMARQLTQEDLAQRTGLSVNFISAMERGINAPSFETLETLAKALEIPVKDLFDFVSLT
jgi:transcriptional regulator with XRE-family HTH domain